MFQFLRLAVREAVTQGGNMVLGLTIVERMTRARGDLRMGVPVVLSGRQGAALVVAVETLTAARLTGLQALGLQASGQPELAPGRDPENPGL